MNSRSIELDHQVVQSKGLLASNMDEEKVMMSIESGKYYNLGSVGGRIWELIESPVSVRRLIESLTAEYEIDPDTCAEQVLDFLHSMQAEKLIVTGKDGVIHS